MKRHRLRGSSMACVLTALILQLLLLSTEAYREVNSSTDSLAGTHASFEPYAAGFVGYYGDASTPSVERLSQYPSDTPRLFFSAPLKQTCPGMVGPGHNGEFYCYSREFGYCDRQSGLCICNQGYTGLDCTACQLGYFKRGGLCLSKISCARYDPRCLSCNSTGCLACADLQLNSVRRSGARRIDQRLPDDERVREFSQTFVYGSQDPRVFDETESFSLAPASYSLLPLNESSVACTQGANSDARWSCSLFPQSHRVCGHRGSFFFVSPLYAVTEAAGNITITVRRSGGGLGRAVLLYDLVHVTTTPGDVSPTMFYTSSQKLEFAPGIVSLAFKLQIHDNHILENSRTFRLHLREPFVPTDLHSIAPATLGNQRSTLVTILDDDALRPVANFSHVLNPETTLQLGGAAGDQMTFQIQSVLGTGVPGVDSFSEAVFLMSSYIEEDDYNQVAFRALQLGSVAQSGGVDVSLLTCYWQRKRAGVYTVAVQLLYPGGLRGEYFGDAGLVEVSGWAPSILSRIDGQVNFTWNGGPAFAGAQSHLSVRWSGWLKPLVTGPAMLAVSAIGYARLWIDNGLVIDQWGAGGDVDDNLPVIRAVSRVNLDVSHYHSLVLEYRAPRRGDVYVQLLWGSIGSAEMKVIPAHQLFSGTHIQKSPFRNVVVTPGKTASTALSTTTMQNEVPFVSPALQVIAGSTFTFNVLPRDAYGNRRRSKDQRGTQQDIITAKLSLVTDRSLGGIGTRTVDALTLWSEELYVFRAVARPQRSGEYSMSVTVNSVALAASPFTVVVVPARLNAAQCVLSGLGLLDGRVAGQAVNVELETRDLYANRIYTGGATGFKFLASLSSSAIPVVATGHLVDNSDGTYQFTYMPRVVGSYSVSITWKGIHLHNSPYWITVVPSTPVGSTSSARGPGIISAKTNVQSTFEVITRDSSGNLVLTGGIASALTLMIEHSVKGNFSGNTCTDLLNGHYTCTYTPYYVGVARLHVRLSEQPITGSPFLIDVTAGPALGSRCVASGDALVSAIAGQRASFNVSIYDASGNLKVNAGSENISAAFTGPSAVGTPANAAETVAYAGGGIFHVEYTLTLKGPYNISVTVDGVAIDASPFIVYVYPTLAAPTTTFLKLLLPTLSVNPPLIFRAGELIVSRLTTQDTFGNTLETGGNFFQLDEDVSAILDVPIADEKNGSYLISLRPKRSVLFPFTPKLMMPGGVNGSYYAVSAVPVGNAAQSSSLIVLKRRDPAISFDFGNRPPSQTYSGGTFSVHWAGFLLPRFSEVYTIHVDVLGIASLRVSDTSVAVQVGTSSAALKVSLTAQTFVDLELNFSKPHEFANASVHLWWSSHSQLREVIPSSQLFTSWSIVNNVPPLNIKPALADPTTFTPEFGMALLPNSATVRAIVDEKFIFTVVARDSYRNKVSGEDYCSLYVLLPQASSGSAQPGILITDLLDGSYKVGLVPHLAGNFVMHIAALPDTKKASVPLDDSALAAFLAPYNIEGSPFKLQVDPGSPNSTTSTLVGGGFVSSTAGVVTSFVLELRDGRANRLTASMVISHLDKVRVKLKTLSRGTEVFAKVSEMGQEDQRFLSAQDVRVEYTATVAGLTAVLLSVDNGKSFSQKTAALRIFPNVATAVMSSVSPNSASVLGPQISTKQSYTYHVTVRDAFGNIRASGGDLLVVRVHGPDSSSGNVTDLGDGNYAVSFCTTLPGAYEIETRVAEPLHGLTGYYYADTKSFQQNLESAVRNVDAVINFDWSKNVSMRGYPRIVWKGFLRPSFTQEYTLWVKLQSATGSGASVYIDGVAVFDGLNAGATSGRVMLVGGQLHSIAVEYRSASVQQSPGYLSLFWQSVQQSAQLIPTQALIAETSELLPRTHLIAVN